MNMLSCKDNCECSLKSRFIFHMCTLNTLMAIYVAYWSWWSVHDHLFHCAYSSLFVVLFSSFCEAIERRGLIEEDNTLDECLTEATLFQMPSSLRRLFATILVFCKPHDVMGLWKKHYDAMLEDYSRNNPSPDLVQQMVLIDIRNLL